MARRPNSDRSGALSHDSFLDIVANIVGILIILVMVVSVRAKNAPVEVSIPGEASQESIDLVLRDRARVGSVRGDVLKVAVEIRKLDRERMLRDVERSQLATAVSLMEQRLDERRSQLDAKNLEQFDLRREIAEAQSQLETLRLKRDQAQRQLAAPIVVESYPTPLSKTVDGEEVHFQLRGGRLASIPLESLIARFTDDARRKAYKLFELPEMTDTVGPEGGFRLRYTMLRYDVSPEDHMTTGQSGSYAKLKRWTLIPVSGQLGETLQEATAEGSEFRRTMAGYRPEKTTVTIWVYPDSFAEFREIKKELFGLGFPTAGRPLPEGTPIGGSPEGSKSAAE